MTALLQVSNSLNDTGDTCSYLASGTNPMFQPSHRVVGRTHSSLWLCRWAEQILEFFTFSRLSPTFPGTGLFYAAQLNFQCPAAWSMVYLCKQEQSQGIRLTVFIHTSLGNTPCHSRWKYKLKGEFILGNPPLLPPEGLWLVRPLEGHKKSTCYSSCTSLTKLLEDVRKGRVCVGKERRGKVDEAEYSE